MVSTQLAKHTILAVCDHCGAELELEGDRNAALSTLRTTGWDVSVDRDRLILACPGCAAGGSTPAGHPDPAALSFTAPGFARGRNNYFTPTQATITRGVITDGAGDPFPSIRLEVESRRSPRDTAPIMLNLGCADMLTLGQALVSFATATMAAQNAKVIRTDNFGPALSTRRHVSNRPPGWCRPSTFP